MIPQSKNDNSDEVAIFLLGICVGMGLTLMLMAGGVL